FVIAGQGEDFEGYRLRMQHPERFEVRNHWIGDRERSELFQRATIVVLPYTEATQSGVVPVAYTFGKPVIATTVGGLPECVEHERTGLLVPPRDSSALADAIVTLLSDPAKCRAYGTAGKEKLDRECSPEVIAQATLGVYRRAIADRRPGSPRQNRVLATGLSESVGSAQDPR
ncbi:MAG TPA: glycosyltransferase, partial [Pirellulaceae bacterium]